MAGFTLGGIAENGYLAPELVGEIFKKAQVGSVVLPVAGSAPLSITGGEYLISTEEPEADIVGEGQRKGVSSFGFTTKVVRPIKAATIVRWSKEARLKNPGQIFDGIQDKLAKAIQRQVDIAVLYGKSARSGVQVTGLDYVNQTTNRVTLGTATAAQGGIAKDITDGAELVADDGYDVTGFVADPRLRFKLLPGFDTTGRPLNTVNLSDTVGSYLGLPVAYGKTVADRIGGRDSGVRAFGGDFDGNIRIGFAEEITISLSNQATLVDQDEEGNDVIVNLWQDNQEAALVEAIFGYYINDVNAFAAYEVESGS